MLIVRKQCNESAVLAWFSVYGAQKIACWVGNVQRGHLKPGLLGVQIKDDFAHVRNFQHDWPKDRRLGVNYSRVQLWWSLRREAGREGILSHQRASFFAKPSCFISQCCEFENSKMVISTVRLINSASGNLERWLGRFSLISSMLSRAAGWKPSLFSSLSTTEFRQEKNDENCFSSRVYASALKSIFPPSPPVSYVFFRG